MAPRAIGKKKPSGSGRLELAKEPGGGDDAGAIVDAQRQRVPPIVGHQELGLARGGESKELRAGDVAGSLRAKTGGGLGNRSASTISDAR